MSEPGNGSGFGGPYDVSGGSGHESAGSHPHDPFEPPERSGLARGVAIVTLGVIVGILLLPSATRSPLAVVQGGTPAAARQEPSSTTTSLPARSTTTTTTTTTALAPAKIHVLVANATSVNGVAGSVTTFLGGKGFATLTAVNALVKLTASQIYFTTAGSGAAASEVASALELAPATVQTAAAKPPVSSAAGASVIVIVGSDLATRFAPASTTTTVKGH
ncbi:MAG: LytR C-terminal domain-containing protein [Acidimicrobiales bacterium]|jgi:hypothetical protein